MQFDVYGVGNALVDIQAEISEDFLKTVLDTDTNDVHTTLAKGAMHLVNTAFQGHLLHLLEQCELHTVSGGSAANTLIGVGRLGGSAAFAGKVGKDVHGAFYAEDMQAAEVQFNVPFGSNETGTSIILITPDAQRSMFTHLGISVELEAEDIDEDAIKNSKWVYIEGYLWDAPGPRAASIRTMELAKKYGVKIAYAYSDSFCVNRAKDDFHNFTKEYVDLVFCNESEGLAFADTDNVDAALQHITALSTGVALTQSEKGSIIELGGQRYNIAPVPTTAVDSTGAGDMYASGVLVGLSQGRGVQAAGDLGSWASSQIVGIRGARLPESYDIPVSLSA